MSLAYRFLALPVFYILGEYNSLSLYCFKLYLTKDIYLLSKGRV